MAFLGISTAKVKQNPTKVWLNNGPFFTIRSKSSCSGIQGFPSNFKINLKPVFQMFFNVDAEP